MPKPTIKSLQATIAKLEAELADANSYIEGCSKMIEGDGLLAVKIERLLNKSEENTMNTVIPVEEAKVLPAFRWVLKYINFKSDTSGDFLSMFDMFTNTEKNWLAIYPKAGAKVGGFLREFNQARFNKGIEGNYWRNNGAWLKIPVAKK